jgi:hypothetical protein
MRETVERPVDEWGRVGTVIPAQPLLCRERSPVVGIAIGMLAVFPNQQPRRLKSDHQTWLDLGCRLLPEAKLDR